MTSLMLVAVLLLLALSPTGAMAQEPPATAQEATQGAAPAAGSSDPEEPPEYRELVDDAVVQFRAGRYAEARALFIRAHDVFPNARTARGIGLCAYELREYVHAVNKLELALTHEVRPLTDAMRARVEQVLEDAQQFVAVYTLEVQPAGAEVLVDGMSVDVEAQLTLPIGTHDLEADHPGYRTLHRQIVVRGGERESLAVALRAGPSGGQGPGDGASGGGSAWWYVGAGVAAVGAGAGVAWWISREGALSDCGSPPEGFAPCDNREVIETERNIAIGFTVGAAAVAGTLLVLGLTDTGSSDDRVSATCTPGFGAVICSGRF